MAAANPYANLLQAPKATAVAAQYPGTIAAQRRSQYLADALKSFEDQSKNIQTPGELGVRLLAEALLQYGKRKADKDLDAAQSDDVKRMGDNVRALIGGGSQAAPDAAPPALGGSASPALDLKPDYSAPITAQPLPPAIPRPSPSPQAQAPAGSPAPAAPPPAQSAPNRVGSPAAANPLAATPGERQLVDMLLSQGRIQEAQSLAEEIAKRAAAPVKNEVMSINGRTVGVNPYDPSRPIVGPQVGVNLQNVNGWLTDQNDPRNAGQFMPQAPTQGATPQFDQNGRFAGWEMPKGAAGAIATAAGAQASGAAYANAPFNFREITSPDGTSQLTAVSNLVGGSMPIQSPAQATLAQGQAQTLSQRLTELPKIQTGMRTLDSTTSTVIDKLDEALKVINSSPMATGMGGLLAGVPGTSAHNLDATLDTIRANVGFDKLQQMRDASPTGGALGSVSERELALLQSVAGSLKQTQNVGQLSANLQSIRDQLKAVQQARHQAFNDTYGALLSGPPAGAPAPPAQARPPGGGGWSIVGVQ